MRPRRRRCAAAVVLGALALTAACGDDDGATSGTAPAAGTTAATTTTPAAGTAPAAGTRPDGFGTATLVPGGPYGQDPTDPHLYKGAGGFVLDTRACPPDWDPGQGISAEEIRLFSSLPKSGPLAALGLFGDGVASYLRYVNDTYGGIGGRKIVLDVKDDAYEPGRTKTNVDEMLQSGRYAATTAMLGTPNNLGVWDELNQECMPHLFVAGGAVQWGDVEHHPWTTPLLLDYFSEAQLWAQWLATQFPDGATVAAITFNNDYGQSYAKGFEAAVQGTSLQLVQQERHDATAPNLTNQFTSLAASGADVLLIETSGTYCTQAMAEVEKSAWRPVVIMAATCQALSQYFQPLIAQGLTGAGTYLVQTYKDVNDPATQDDPAVRLFRQVVQSQGLDPAQTPYGTGWLFAWYTTEVLRLAATLPGGLDRANIIVANRSINARMPLLIEGLTGHMEGLRDAYLIEGGRMVQYQVTDPAKLGTYQPVSDLITNEGQLGTYAAVGAGGG